MNNNGVLHQQSYLQAYRWYDNAETSGKYVIGLSHSIKMHLMPKRVVFYVNLGYNEKVRSVGVCVADILCCYQSVIQLSVVT